MGITKAGIPWINDSTGGTDYLLTTNFGGGSLPVGTVLPYSASDVPTGYLLCNGASYDTGIYASLYAKIQQKTVPDMRGLFLRGLDTTGAMDPQGLTRGLLSFEEGTYIIGPQNWYGWPAMMMQGTVPDMGLDYVTTQKSGSTGGLQQFTPANSRGSMTAYVPGTSSVDQFGTVRPKNIAVNYIIKAV